jgi:hypothetical protein
VWLVWFGVGFSIFWDITPYSPVESQSTFRGNIATVFIVEELAKEEGGVKRALCLATMRPAQIMSASTRVHTDWLFLRIKGCPM